MLSLWEHALPFSRCILAVVNCLFSLEVARMFRLMSLALFVLLLLGNLVVLPGCGSSPPSELTPEQLEQQMAEDAQSWADEDRAEKEQMAKQRRGN
jgi:hypothetical protein